MHSSAAKQDLQGYSFTALQDPDLPILPRKYEARVDNQVMDCTKLTKQA
jgi:hypothetical protein